MKKMPMKRICPTCKQSLPIGPIRKKEIARRTKRIRKMFATGRCSRQDIVKILKLPYAIVQKAVAGMKGLREGDKKITCACGKRMTVFQHNVHSEHWKWRADDAIHFPTAAEISRHRRSWFYKREKIYMKPVDGVWIWTKKKKRKKAAPGA